jgi:transcription-repair coupling factor (superfamily II helicase)
LRVATGTRFETEDLLVITEQDILGDRLVRRTKKAKRADNFLTETQSLSPGDLVVHVDHGVGVSKRWKLSAQQAPIMNACCLNMPKVQTLFARGEHRAIVALRS